MTEISSLEAAFRHAGEEWYIDRNHSPSQAIDHIQQVLARVHQRAQERLGTNAPDLREAAIVEAYWRHPSQVKGFFQVLYRILNPDTLLMVWRIIQGMEIKDVQISYRRKKFYRMCIVLESSDEVEDAPYESENIEDFILLRHIGIMQIGNSPILEGFYPLRLK